MVRVGHRAQTSLRAYHPRPQAPARHGRGERADVRDGGDQRGRVSRCVGCAPVGCGYMPTCLRGYMATWLHGYMATWLHGYMATWLHGYMATWLHGYMATWLHGYMAT